MRKRRVTILIYIVLLLHLHLFSREQQNQKMQTGEQKAPAKDYPIITTNQYSKDLEVYDFHSKNLDNQSDLQWSWKPNPEDGYSSAEILKWSNPSGVKLRNSSLWGGQWIIATASGGLATIAAYPSGTKKWALNVGGNPHDAELLPNGNIAIAASTGNYIRVYASSQGESNYTYAEFIFYDAHGVLWDPAINRLWVLGHLEKHGPCILTALKIEGNDAQPKISEDQKYRYTVPTKGGHNLTAFCGDTNKLWISTASKVYVFNKLTGSFTEAPGVINRPGVKSITNQPSGRVVTTCPDGVKKPVPFEPSNLNAWSTSYIDVYTAEGVWLFSQHRKNGVSFYKAKVFNAEYQ
jgi:hypothetical protein